MSYTHKSSYSYNDRQIEIVSIHYPNTCPICNHGISPVFIALARTSNSTGSIFFTCKACETNFISYFVYYSQPGKSYGEFKEYSNHAPISYKSEEFSEVITKLSKRFVDTYNQAKYAQDLKLFEISGMGYRKSLEILIKDYAIKKYPDDAASIIEPNFTLKNCIDKYITDERIKNSTIAASWIGNDETHYLKRHENKDVSDLIQFVKNVVFFIQYDLSADAAADFVKK